MGLFQEGHCVWAHISGAEGISGGQGLKENFSKVYMRMARMSLCTGYERTYTRIFGIWT